ncbi:hypothetical protein [Pinisolibacter aquiterrae]|uniref:hypothetical protein n=1 Tax=Pinisolibacter aquiterrae TaxID=2815579 RepID=UPI001C3D7412|nr:hypothetical protein [Pinisolibacter aquiterrae]MBV5264575.1 hypothetical protein [Pinisolibacter aquiterrae]MCC8233344.1 hypothetical protein [Pinisolibacter aquiterrae]
MQEVVDVDVLDAFIGHPEFRALEACNAQEPVQRIRWATAVFTAVMARDALATMITTAIVAALVTVADMGYVANVGATLAGGGSRRRSSARSPASSPRRLLSGPFAPGRPIDLLRHADDPSRVKIARGQRAPRPRHGHLLRAKERTSYEYMK